MFYNLAYGKDSSKLSRFIKCFASAVVEGCPDQSKYQGSFTASLLSQFTGDTHIVSSVSLIAASYTNNDSLASTLSGIALVSNATTIV